MRESLPRCLSPFYLETKAESLAIIAFCFFVIESMNSRCKPSANISKLLTIFIAFTIVVANSRPKVEGWNQD
ncbi:MAG: hypothetical protein CLLPBCKN_006263 [Chroococcidiopsis cubana SAG 39.79]|nr:hypothetical protein [Chroococcidiopsis cubana SAG 39.79]